MNKPNNWQLAERDRIIDSARDEDHARDEMMEQWGSTRPQSWEWEDEDRW